MDVARLEQALAEARKRAEHAMERLEKGGAEAEDAFAAAMDDEAAAARALAAARGEEHAIPFELGVRWSGGAPLPHLISSGLQSFVAFYLEDPDWDGTYATMIDPTDEGPNALAVLEFKGCSAVKLGPPNDEVLDGHPLYERGLAGYGAYVVENSRWLNELVEINRVHEQFDAQEWADAKHFLLVFHDETVEAIARTIEVETVRASMPALLAQTIGRLWPEPERSRFETIVREARGLRHVHFAWRADAADDELVTLTESYGGRSEAGWWDRIRPHSLGWVTARADDGTLVGFVNVAWDGGDHAFLIDTKVRPDHQRRGIGTELVRIAARHAKEAGCEWMEVDFDEGLEPFYYDTCGFVPTRAGLLHLPDLDSSKLS